MLHHDYQSSSPWASTHSLGLIRDVPVPPLDTSVDARERKRLTGGTPLSPSVSEHLLPSNLFGPDEDSIRTSPYIDKLLESSPRPYETPSLQTTLPSSSIMGQRPQTDSPISEMSTRSSFSSPNQSYPALPLYPDRLFQQDTQSSPTIVMTPPPAPPPLFDHTSVIVADEEPVEVASPSELNGIPLSAESGENTDEEILQPESSSTLKHWKIPSISFKRKTIPPEKRLPMLGSLKGEKSRSMPRTSAGVTPIGFNRPRWGSGSSSGWLTQMTRARAPSETGRQFDTNFDPLESRRLLEGAGVVHQQSSFPSSVDFRTSPTSPRTSFDSRIFERRSTDTEMAARIYMGGGAGPVTPSKGSLYRPSSVYSDFSIPYNHWISTAPLSLPTSPSAGIGTPASPILHPSQWSPPNTSRSSLDPKAPEFRTSLQQFITPVEPPESAEVADLPKRGASLFSLPRRSTVRQPGDSFMNTFTGLFRRESKINEDEDANAGNELSRPRSQDTQNSVTDHLTMTISGSMEDVGASVEPTPEKKKKEKKKKEKVKGKSLFRWTDSTASTSMAAPVEDPELKSLKSMESIQDQEADESASAKKKRKKKEKVKKGVKFEKDVSGDGESFISGVSGVGTGAQEYEWNI